MTMKNTSQREQPQANPENARPSNAPSPPDAHHVRKRRIDEYESQGLDNPEPDVSFWAVTQADLFRVAIDLAVEAKQAIRGCSTCKTLADADPAMKRYLAVTRRIVRYAPLEIRASLIRK